MSAELHTNFLNFLRNVNDSLSDSGNTGVSSSLFYRVEDIGAILSRNVLLIPSVATAEITKEMVLLQDRVSLVYPSSKAKEDLLFLMQVVNQKEEKRQRIAAEFPPDRFYYGTTEVVGLSRLKKLELKGCRLKELPLVVSKLQALQELHIPNNLFTQIPEFVFGLPKLRRLNLNGNKIKKLGDEVRGLNKIILLALSRNKLTDLPAQFSSLTKLQVLFISGNSFTVMPEVIAKLSNLRWLNLRSTGLVEFSPVKLPNLTTLDVSDNNLREIFNEKTHLPNLRDVRIQENPKVGRIDGLFGYSQLEHLTCDAGLLPNFPEELVLDTRLLTVRCNDKVIWDRKLNGDKFVVLAP